MWVEPMLGHRAPRGGFTCLRTVLKFCFPADAPDVWPAGVHMWLPSGAVRDPIRTRTLGSRPWHLQVRIRSCTPQVPPDLGRECDSSSHAARERNAPWRRTRLDALRSRRRSVVQVRCCSRSARSRVPPAEGAGRQQASPRIKPAGRERRAGCQHPRARELIRTCGARAHQVACPASAW